MTGIERTDLHLADGIATLTLNFPAGRNALVPGVKSDLTMYLEAMTQEPDCRAIVITGANKTFCSGGNVKGMHDANGPNGAKRLAELQHIVRLIATAKKPVVAAVEGNAAGGGMSLAAACDVVIAAENARFSGAAVKIGLVSDMGAVWFLRQRMGVGAARYFLITGNVLTAPEAANLGLVDRLAPREKALEVAQAQAAQFAAGSATALFYTKHAFLQEPESLNEALSQELETQNQCFASKDFEEGRTAFLEKRAPKFTDTV